jgi:hypothetical protein
LISAAASFLADIVVPLVSFVLEMCMHILIASVRPWRYLFSPSFRTEVNALHAHKHPIIKWWHLVWGSFLLAASVAVVYGLFWFWSLASNQPEPPPSLRQQAVKKVEQTMIDKFKKHQESKQ